MIFEQGKMCDTREENIRFLYWEQIEALANYIKESLVLDSVNKDETMFAYRS